MAIYSLPRLLNEIRDTHRAERSHVDLLDRLTAVDLLHIDDVGAERTHRLGARGALLDRQRALRGSALDGDHHELLDHTKLGEQISERTVSRLTEMCDVLPLSGEDRRIALRSA